MSENLEVEWLETGSHTVCPHCGDQDIRVRQIIKIGKPATLAGVQLKFDGVSAWVYKCFACGETGDSTPKTPKEYGTWVDGREHPEN